MWERKHFSSRYWCIICLMALSAIKFSTLQTFSQEVTYHATGYVFDSLNVGISNVNISVVGSKQGGTTNKEGYFSIKLNKSPSVLYFSYMGYKVTGYQVTPENAEDIIIYLTKEIKEIGEVVISAQKIQKAFRGDTLHIVDYEILGDRILMVAYPYKRPASLQLYLATLSGDTLNSRKIKKAGKEIQFPESPFPVLIYFFKDCYGRVQFLTKDRIWQVYIERNKVYLIYPSKYPQFLGLLLPMKQEFGDNLFYQVSNATLNETCCIHKGDTIPKSIKLVHDEFGEVRYMFGRNVSAPILKFNDRILIFDFFDNHIEYFDSEGNSTRKVPISFHQKVIYNAFGQKSYDLDQPYFTQQILMDEKTGKAYGMWKAKVNRRVSLREINLETGEIERIVEIPDHPNIDKVRIYDNVVYFMYNEKKYPFYQSMYRMGIGD